MDMHDYTFLLDVAYRTLGRYEAMCLLYAGRVADGEPGIAAQLTLFRTHRDRALVDLTTLRAQGDEIAKPRIIWRDIPRLSAPIEIHARHFDVSGPGALDAAL